MPDSKLQACRRRYGEGILSSVPRRKNRSVRRTVPTARRRADYPRRDPRVRKEERTHSNAGPAAGHGRTGPPASRDDALRSSRRAGRIQRNASSKPRGANRRTRQQDPAPRIAVRQRASCDRSEDGFRRRSYREPPSEKHGETRQPRERQDEVAGEEHRQKSSIRGGRRPARRIEPTAYPRAVAEGRLVGKPRPGHAGPQRQADCGPGADPPLRSSKRRDLCASYG